jgi:hypothetical protein
MDLSIPTWMYVTLGLSLIVILVVDILVRYINVRHLVRQKTVLLELTPPATAKKSPEATTQFFTVLHTVMQLQTWRDVFIGRRNTFSLEVASTREHGIRYYIRLPDRDAALFQQQITAYLPDIRFKRVEEYLDSSMSESSYNSVADYKQARHFAYPLASHDSLSEHDPIAYITAAMTKLSPHELIVFQMVLSPANPREASKISNKLILGKTLRLSRIHWPLPFRIVGHIIRFFFGILRFVLEVIGEMIRPRYELPKKYNVTVPQTTTRAQNTIDSINQKLSQSLFEASVRTLIVSKEKSKINQNSKGLQAALGSFKVIGYQALHPRGHFPSIITVRYRFYQFRHRMPALFTNNSMVLAVSEAASLFHFPYSGTNAIENVISSLSRTLPAPVSLKDDSPLSVLIGENNHHGSTTPIGLTESERERHMYIIGGTGNGKTTMLQYAIVQDIQNGHGVAVIDPHGDMAKEIASRIPEHRIKDVIYFNPDDLSYPIGMNLLELDENLEGDDLLREKDLITESVVSIFRKIFSDDDSGGHRIEYILRNATQTALTIKDATLFTIYDLLNDGKYRRKVITKLTDENLQKFWRNEFGKAGNFQQIKMAAGITAKVGRFLFSASAKRILEQPKSTINFDDIMNESKILICNFSKGMIGEDTSELLGTAVLAKLQLASLRRARIEQDDRKPFYLYVDEFQNFATVSFVQMLSESRKYKLFLTMAEQSTSQQADKDMINVILANVGTVVTFRTGNPADEKILLPLFNPYLNEGEIMNLASFNFYMRLAAVHSQEPLSGMTLLLNDHVSKDTFNKVVSESRKSHGVKPILKTSIDSNMNPVSNRADTTNIPEEKVTA